MPPTALAVMRAGTDPLEASLRMLGAAAADVIGVLDRGDEVDPLDERDVAREGGEDRARDR